LNPKRNIGDPVPDFGNAVRKEVNWIKSDDWDAILTKVVNSFKYQPDL